MMFNGQFIELNLKLADSDMIFSVNFTTRSSELLGVIEKKYLIIYRNDNGRLQESLTLNHTRFDLRDNLIKESLCFYNRDLDFVTFIGRERVYRINLANTTMQESKLRGTLQNGGGLFVDAQCFYFLVNSTIDGLQKGNTMLTCADTSMIDASFVDSSTIDGPAAIQESNAKASI